MGFLKASVGILLLHLVLVAAVAQETTFSSQSNVVLVPALVKNADGEAVYGLEATDFIVEDNGVKQTAYLDEAAESEPLSMVVAIQCGRRAKYEFSRMRGLDSMLEPLLNGQQDVQIAVVTFDHELKLVRDFTGDSKLIQEDLTSLQSGDHGAAILDAVDYSVKLLAKQPERHQRVLLLISETRDHGSHFAKLDDVVKLIGVTNTVVYALPFSPSLSNVLDTERGSNKDEMHAYADVLAPMLMARQAMRKNVPKAIASMTGGEYDLFASRKGFETRMNSFANHLHSRYLLSFEPKNPEPGLHVIRVRLRDPRKETVLFRGNYWAAGVNR